MVIPAWLRAVDRYMGFYFLEIGVIWTTGLLSGSNAQKTIAFSSQLLPHRNIYIQCVLRVHLLESNICKLK